MNYNYTIENNKLIAEFMELDFSNGAYHFKKSDRHLREWIKEDKLKYHESWDWLMMVVDKINNGYNNKYSFIITSYGAKIYEDEELYSNSSNNVKECVYNTIIEFITKSNN